MPFTIAIDGPAGAGKSSVSRRVARAVGITYLDTGAMYRALALKANRLQLAAADVVMLITLVSDLNITFSPLSESYEQKIYLDEEDVSEAIRTPKISQFTSAVSVIPGVRSGIVALQRELAKRDPSGALLEGRDIGTVVCPEADLKIFLTASAEERARRRVDQSKRLGVDAHYEEVLEEQIERDTRDSSRIDSPLRSADDAVIIVSDGLTLDEVVQQIVNLANEKRSVKE